MKKWMIVIMLLGMLGGCSRSPQVPVDAQSTQEQAKYQKITPKEAKELMDGGDVIVLDVRTEAEYRQGYIKGAILIPDTEIAQKSGEMLPDKDKTILVYCRTGRRSELAAKELIEIGYTDVRDFGGIVDWPYEIEK